MLANKTITTLYNPGEKDREVLKAEFVIRLKEFNNIFNDIKTSKMEKPEQHYLLIGQRGSGKSTLIQRLRYAIEDDTELSQWLIPIAFTEEQYNITELGNLWERIAENLEDYHHMPGLVADLEQQLDKKDAEKKQLDVLLSWLRKHNKKIVVFIDNIGDMLKKFEDIEVKRLRAVLQTVPEIRIIAATPVMLDEVSDYQKALFEFFKNIRLAGLNREEMETLLRKLGETHNSVDEMEVIIKEYPERIEILRRLTGGIARTVVMMYNVFIESAEGNPIEDLQLILDQATPLYKHKMDDLPIQQQKIIDTVAKSWDAISAGEIAEKLRMESKNVSAHLRQLEKDQWIEKKGTSTKNNLYEIQERFFNIWYLMRNGRRFEKGRVIWFIKYMESAHEKFGVEKNIKKLIQKLEEGTFEINGTLFWCEVYLGCHDVSPYLKFKLMDLIERNLPESIKEQIKILQDKKGEYFNEMLLNSDKLSGEDREELKIYFKTYFEDSWSFVFLLAMIIIVIKFDKNQLPAMIKLLELLSEIDEKGRIDAMLGGIYLGADDYTLAEKYFLSAIRKNDKSALELLLVLYIQAQPNKQKALELLKTIADTAQLENPILIAFTLLWNNDVDGATNLFKSLDINKIDVSDMNDFFILLIAKVQFQVAKELLNDEQRQLKAKLAPIYYALMHYMKDEYPNEYLRMPPEMKETVEDVIKKIEEYKVKYV